MSCVGSTEHRHGPSGSVGAAGRRRPPQAPRDVVVSLQRRWWLSTVRSIARRRRDGISVGGPGAAIESVPIVRMYALIISLNVPSGRIRQLSTVLVCDHVGRRV